MSFIVMQPDDSPESEQAIEKLKPYEDNEFDTSLGNVRLKPIAAGC